MISGQTVISSQTFSPNLFAESVLEAPSAPTHTEGSALRERWHGSAGRSGESSVCIFALLRKITTDNSGTSTESDLVFGLPFRSRKPGPDITRQALVRSRPFKAGVPRHRPLPEQSRAENSQLTPPIAENGSMNSGRG